MMYILTFPPFDFSFCVLVTLFTSDVISPHLKFEKEWEAYVSDSDSDGEGRGSWPDMLSLEERDRQRREREESRRVLSELKAVLGFRASEGERMKRKQLLFNDQGLS